MSHNLIKNSITGKYEFMAAGAAAWHHLGTVVKDVQTWMETIKLAGLDWTISKHQLEFAGVDINSFGLFRDDYLIKARELQNEEKHDEADAMIAKAFLCDTTGTYQQIQNYQMFHFLDALVQGDGKAHYECAGAINGGKQVFALVNLNSAFEVGSSGDRYENYLLFTDDRTGNRSGKVFLTNIRVVCANTLEWALRNDEQSKGKATVNFPHRANVNEKLAEAAELFQTGRMDVTKLRDKLELLAERQLDKSMLMEVLDKAFPAEKDETDRAKVARENKQAEVINLFVDNDSNMFPEQANTALALANALTRYTDHVEPIRRTKTKMTQTDDEIRAERAMFGSGAAFKREAMDLVLQLTANAPTHRKVYSTGADGVQVAELEEVKNDGGEIYGDLLSQILDDADNKNK